MNNKLNLRIRESMKARFENRLLSGKIRWVLVQMETNGYRYIRECRRRPKYWKIKPGQKLLRASKIFELNIETLYK